MKKQLRLANKNQHSMGSIHVSVVSKHLLLVSVNLWLCNEIVTDKHLQNKYFHLQELIIGIFTPRGEF